MANGSRMALDTSPTARALLALEAIQAAPGVTAARLGDRLGVSDRAARRCVAVLREAGIPVESLTGPYGGYRIGRGARIPPLAFTGDEALGLVMAVLQAWHGSIESEHPAATALGKIFRVLPTPAAALVEAVRRVQARNPGDAAAIPDPRLTAQVAQACSEGRRLRVDYRTGYRPVLDPWAVVVRHGRWYLLGRVAGRDDRRVLRLDRITGIEETGEAADPPPELDPVREVEEHLAKGWPYATHVAIAASAEQVAPCVPRVLGRLEPAGPNACVLRGSTENPPWYAEQLATIPAPFTVIGSDEIRSAVRQLAQRLSAAVDPPTP